MWWAAMSWHDGRVQTGTGDQPPCPRRARCPVPVFSVPAILRQLAPARRSLNTPRPQVVNTTHYLLCMFSIEGSELPQCCQYYPAE